jgi:UDP-3-O-[3-hydroxymyristoyl] N-acetylglucosamine deacetylase
MTDCFTVAQPLIFSGVGIHSGRPSQIVLKPKQTAGCVFVHSVSKQTLAIAPQNLLEMDRGTCLQNKGMKVFTIEHLLCALYAHQIFAVEIEINSEEIPIFDGSAKKYFDDLKNIKKQKISAALDSLKIKKEIRLEKNRSYLLAKPADHFEIDLTIDFPKPIGVQKLKFREKDWQSFGEQIAPARTFGAMSDLETLQAKGLSQGVSHDNAVGYSDQGYTKPLLWPDEPARHKLLDLIGDLFVLGRPLQAQIEAYCPGHTLNGRLVKALDAQTDKVS